MGFPNSQIWKRTGWGRLDLWSIATQSSRETRPFPSLSKKEKMRPNRSVSMLLKAGPTFQTSSKPWDMTPLFLLKMERISTFWCLLSRDERISQKWLDLENINKLTCRCDLWVFELEIVPLEKKKNTVFKLVEIPIKIPILFFRNKRESVFFRNKRGWFGWAYFIGEKGPYCLIEKKKEKGN